MFFLDLMIKYVFFYSGSDFLKEFVKRIWNKNMLFVKFYVLFFILGWFFGCGDFFVIFLKVLG